MTNARVMLILSLVLLALATFATIWVWPDIMAIFAGMTMVGASLTALASYWRLKGARHQDPGKVG